MQAATGIFVVHARLDARIAARVAGLPEVGNARAAWICVAIMAIAGAWLISASSVWIGIALWVAAVGYSLELARQSNASGLQMPLKRVGLQALALSTGYAAMLVIGLWTARS